ncbi:GntR family transcriptional regulator [Verrucomicrobiales bacterium]|jgi:DNA-binding GntR family transcriptional regulator|nr:GntR family transcriptional regulator [Verrucomicrobiales bacterium]
MSVSSLSEKAYQHIRQQVFLGELSPGDRLVNRSLAEQLGTSFIPVREAISRLASEGLVKQVAGAGAFVRSFDRQEISEIYDVRDLFEPFAAAQAARFLTDHELEELRVLLESWESLGKKILNRKADTSQGDLDRWLEINERFHSLIISASRNRLLSKITNDVNVLSKCFAAHRGSPKLLSEKLVRSTLKTHRQLYEALIKRDSESARKIVCQQLKFGRKSVLNFFDQEQTP